MAKPKCKLIGKDGNVFNLMGLAKKALEAVDQRAEAKLMSARIFECGSYNEALTILGEYVEIY